ncbi:MAG: TetR family transcriptional regulator [Candidatus Acidiferrales bacterium]
MPELQPRFSAPVGRQAQKKLQRIVHAAARVFYEKGYEGASIRDISRASGVSLAGLYYYINSKQKLLYLIQAYTFKTVLERLEERLAGVSDPLEKLKVLVRNHLGYFLQHPVEMKVLSHEDEALEGEYRREILQIKRRYYAIALGIFDELRHRGLTRRMNPRVAVLSLFGMMNWVYTWHRPKIDPGTDALAETMAGMFLHGVAGGHTLSRGKEPRTIRSRRVSVAGRAA